MAMKRRKFIKSTGSGIAAALVGAGALAGCSVGSMARGGDRNRTGIAEENSKAGDDRWAPRHNASGMDLPVQGYTTRESVAPGETLEFCISSEQAYQIEIHRIGWYGGAGGRPLTTVEGHPLSQPKPRPQAEDRKLVTCDWEVTDRIDVPTDWVSGLYYARFVPEIAEEVAAFPFVVKEQTPSTAAVLQLPMNTLSAYNSWGGASLYGHRTADKFDSPGDAVSFDRPYTNPYHSHIAYAIHLIRWMEKEGFDVSYIVNTDMDRDPDLISNYKLAICAGHSEFWSVPQYKSFKRARDQGTNLAFMGGNMGMWSVDFRSGNHRTYNCDKDDSALMFRNRGMPEAELTGLKGSGAGLWKLPNLTVDASSLDHVWMEGTGFEAGDEVVGVVGHEWDFTAEESPDDLTRYFHYESGTSQWDELTGDEDADVVSYKASSGATVFHSSTLGYPYQLDPDPTWDHAWPYSRVREYKPEVMEPNPQLQNFQRNVFDDLMRS
jgi:hypothetical protein